MTVKAGLSRFRARRNIEKSNMKRIAIQGFQGSFHDIAAHQYFQGEQIQLICCATFEQVFDNMRRDPTVIGMMA